MSSKPSFTDVLLRDGCCVARNREIAEALLRDAGVAIPDVIAVTTTTGHIELRYGLTLEFGKPCYGQPPKIRQAEEIVPFRLTTSQSADATAARLAVCATCPEKDGDRCKAASCGCSLERTAATPWVECPKSLWAVVPPESAPTV